MEDLPCPACGFLTLDGQYGSYAICPVCGWEDDGVQLANPTSAGGANSKSLANAQDSAIARFPLHVEIASGFRRSRSWRPLSDLEIQRFDVRRIQEHWHAKAVWNEAETYWSDSPEFDVG